MSRKVIYTVITNDYDIPKPVKRQNGFDYIMFTDNKDLTVQGWDVRYTNKPQRHLKLYPFEELKDYDASIYIDGNISIVGNMANFIGSINSDFTTFKHPLRNCFIQEHYECINRNKAEPDLIREQLAYNIKLGLEPNKGMYQTGVIYRRHTDDVKAFCADWLNELKKFTHRDQLSIMTAVFNTGFKPNGIDWRLFNKFFRIDKHKPNEKPKVYYFTPYDTEGNIGRAINAHCRLVPNDSWIAVMDGDMLFPNPQWGMIVEKAIQQYGDKYSLLGCVTNRVGGEHQRVDAMFSEYDLREHYKKSIEIEDSEVIDTSGVAGYFMLFKKSTWDKVKGFTEDTSKAYIFDTDFNKRVRSSGGKVGLIKGLYALHLYRIWEGDNVTKARNSTKHLFVNR